jgi:hypothetical protein
MEPAAKIAKTGRSALKLKLAVRGFTSWVLSEESGDELL